MKKNYRYLSKPFLTWLLANILGFGALGASALVFPAILGRSGFFTTAFFMAIPISLVQWIALRRILPTPVLWILTISIGILLAFLILEGIPDGFWQVLGDDESIAALTAGYLVLGLAVGLPQWLILRRQLMRSSVWLLGSSMGASAGLWIILVTDLISQSGSISYIVVVLVYSIITGLTLAGLLAYNDHAQTNLVPAT